MTYKEMEMKTVEERIKKIIEKDATIKDIDDVIKKYGDFQTFKEKNNLNNALGRNNNPMTNEDYLEVLDKLKKFYDNQKGFSKENIETVNAGDKKIVSYKSDDGKIILDDSYNNKPFEEQLSIFQNTNSDFRTQNLKTNTDNMMKHMQQEVKEEIKPKLLKEFDMNYLNDDDKKLYATALLFQEELHNPIKIDMHRKLIFDNDNNIYNVEKRENGFVILPTKSNEKKLNTQKKAMVKKLVKTPITTGKNGFIDAAILAFITGSFFGSLVLNLFLKIAK